MNLTMAAPQIKAAKLFIYRKNMLLSVLFVNDGRKMVCKS